WLNAVAEASNLDPKIAKVKLYGGIPEDFDPNTIDRLVYANGRLTPLGLWYVRTDAPIFTVVDRVIQDIRSVIMEKPGVEQFNATDIAIRTNLSTPDVRQALLMLSELGRFIPSGTRAEDGYTSIGLQGDHAYDEYLHYKNL